MKNILIADGHAGTFSYFRVQPVGRRFSITADTTAGREVILGTFIERSAALLAVQFIMESEAPLIDYQTLAQDAAECIASIQHTDDEDDHVVSFPLPTLKYPLQPQKGSTPVDHADIMRQLNDLAQRTAALSKEDTYDDNLRLSKEDLYDDNFRLVCSLKEFAERENG